MRHSDILNEIRGLAEIYVPEWRMNAENPDAGTAFALTFADMLADTYEKLNRLPEKHHIELLKAAGLPLLKKNTASGTVVFSLASGAEDGCVVDADTPVFTDDGIVFTTAYPVYVSPARLQSVYYCNQDRIFKNGEGEFPVNVFDRAKNRQEHVLYIRNDMLLNVSSKTKLRVAVAGKETGLLANPELAQWQYFTGEWTDFGDVSYENGIFSMTVEEAAKPYAIEDQEGFWIRVKALSEDISSAEIRRIGMGTESESPCEVKAYHDDTECDNSGFYPFGKSLSLYADCHIACADAFGKKNAQIEISFTLESIVQEILNPVPDTPIQWRRVMRKREFKAPPVYDVRLERIVAEYWNGQDFVRLPGVSGTLLSTVSQPERKKLSFQCPSDMELTVMHGIDARWIRLRVLDVSNIYKTNARHIVPRISDISVNYAYPDENIPCVYLAYNNGRQNDAKIPFDYTYHKEKAVYWGFDRALDKSPAGLFWNLEQESKLGYVRWRLFSNGEWKAASSVGSFGQTGVVTLFFEDPMEPCECFGETLYWIKMELSDNPTGAVVLKDLNLGAVSAFQKTQKQTVEESVTVRDLTKLIPIDTDSISDLEVFVDSEASSDARRWKLWRENEAGSFKITGDGIFFDEEALRRISRYKTHPVIRVSFRLTEGEAGNCAPGAVCKMNQSIGYISGVTNPLPMIGGRDVETPAEFVARGAVKMKHRGRAVTSGDFEALTVEAMGSLIKCKALPGLYMSGKPAHGGVITVVCLPSRRGDMNARRCKIINDYLSSRAMPNLSIFVREAVYVEVCVWARIRARDMFALKLREDIENGLETFLHPVKGNFLESGYAIGEVPDESRILSFILSVKGVDGVDNFAITAVQSDGTKRTDVDIASLPNALFSVPVSGSHRIEVVNAR